MFDIRQVSVSKHVSIFTSPQMKSTLHSDRIDISSAADSDHHQIDIDQ